MGIFFLLCTYCVANTFCIYVMEWKVLVWPCVLDFCTEEQAFGPPLIVLSLAIVVNVNVILLPPGGHEWIMPLKMPGAQTPLIGVISCLVFIPCGEQLWWPHKIEAITFLVFIIKANMDYWVQKQYTILEYSCVTCFKKILKLEFSRCF